MRQYFADYRGKTASVSVKNNSGSGAAIKIDRFTVTERSIVPGDDTVCPDAYGNEFENGSTEDWMLGDVFEISQYHSWGAVNRNTLKPAGKLEVDASDGGGKEKRNGNVNVWFAKTLTFDKDVSALTYSVTGGAKSKLSLYADGRYIVVYDWTQSKNVGAASFDTSALALNGKTVTFVFEVRDNAANDDGVEQDFYLDYFRLA